MSTSRNQWASDPRREHGRAGPGRRMPGRPSGDHGSRPLLCDDARPTLSSRWVTSNAATASAGRAPGMGEPKPSEGAPRRTSSRGVGRPVSPVQWARGRPGDESRCDSEQDREVTGSGMGGETGAQRDGGGEQLLRAPSSPCAATLPSGGMIAVYPVGAACRTARSISRARIRAAATSVAGTSSVV